MNAPVYVISLARCPERRHWMTDQFGRAGIAFEFLDAVDGNALPPGPMAVPGGELLYPGEQACARSHLAAWRRLLASDAPGAFVFEDDAEILPGFQRNVLDEVAALARPGEVVLLHSSCRETWLRCRRRMTTWRGAIAYALGETMLATAYYLTRAGAVAMVARWEEDDIRFPVDHWCCRDPVGASWASTLAVLTVKPDIFDQHIAFPSEISALGRGGLDGAAFSRHRRTYRFNWHHAPRDALRYVRRLLRRTLARPACLSRSRAARCG